MADSIVRAPEFLPGFTWLNTTRPLTVAEDLRGRVAVLDFWTYCCINCMHVLPILSRLERRFEKDPVVVIGVHSAKFISERDPENIRRAMARYGVRHPVVVDADHDIWEQFAVRAWPTIILVDAAGRIRANLPGEPREADLARRIDALLAEGKGEGILAEGPLEVAPEDDAASGTLRFPGKIHASRGRIFIADSGHHRIIVADPEGRVESIIGEGGVGAHDGPAAHASFQDPQGLAVMGDTLYIADTRNHLIRAADLPSLQVRTVAGTAEMGRGLGAYDPRDPVSIPLRSPWGLLAVGDQLLIAMAGSHQIWVLDTARSVLGPWAGSGREDHVDGPLAEAAFAQPSGLALAGRFVLVADSEISSIRAIDLQEAAVRTIVGRGLFDFGDQDGAPDNVLLQHPLDVAVDSNVLYVADTYNNKIKAIAFGSMETRTVLGDGTPARLHEPGGITVHEGKILIADTNNHRLVRGDPATGTLEPFELALPGART